MRAQAVVDDPVADADHEAADDRRVGAHGGLHVTAELLAQRIANALLERVVDRDRGDDLGAYNAGRLVSERVVVGQDLADDAHAAALDEEAREVACLGGNAVEESKAFADPIRKTRPGI